MNGTRRRVPPPAAPRPAKARPAAPYTPPLLPIPPGTRRIIIAANTRSPLGPVHLRRGDYLLQINRCLRREQLQPPPGAPLGLILRSGKGDKWFTPAGGINGFHAVLCITDEALRPLPWWQAYERAAPGRRPTSGFIAAHLAAAHGLPVVLLGFAPAEDAGAYRWPGHAWDYEAAVYARPDSPFTILQDLP